MSGHSPDSAPVRPCRNPHECGMVVFQAAGEYSKERIWRDLHRLMAVSGSDTVCAEAGCFGDLFGVPGMAHSALTGAVPVHVVVAG